LCSCPCPRSHGEHAGHPMFQECSLWFTPHGIIRRSIPVKMMTRVSAAGDGADGVVNDGLVLTVLVAMVLVTVVLLVMTVLAVRLIKTEGIPRPMFWVLPKVEKNPSPGAESIKSILTPYVGVDKV
ncbi:hypothetical protein H1C71_018657, partial [Ictidomys tridecemlineatus]